MILMEGSQLLQSYPLALVQLDSNFSGESSAVDSAHSTSDVLVSYTMHSKNINSTNHHYGSHLTLYYSPTTHINGGCRSHYHSRS